MLLLLEEEIEGCFESTFQTFFQVFLVNVHFEIQEVKMKYSLTEGSKNVQKSVFSFCVSF